MRNIDRERMNLIRIYKVNRLVGDQSHGYTIFTYAWIINYLKLYIEYYDLRLRMLLPIPYFSTYSSYLYSFSTLPYAFSVPQGEDWAGIHIFVYSYTLQFSLSACLCRFLVTRIFGVTTSPISHTFSNMVLNGGLGKKRKLRRF